MKKWLKILLVIVGSLAALIIIFSLVISPIAHWYIEKNSKELCGRIVKMDDLTINIFKGTVDIEKFTALEQNDKDQFIIFNRLKVNLTLWKLLSQQLKFTEITLDNPNVIIIQNDDRFNFTDIIEHFSSDEEDDGEESSWSFDLQNITLINGSILYRDAVVNSRFNMKELALEIPRIYFTNEKTDVGINLKFADGGDLSLKLRYARETNMYNLNVIMNQFSLADITPYLKQYLNINTFGGKLTTNLNISGNMNHILDITGNGTIQLDHLAATNLENQPLAEVQQIKIDIDSMNVKNNVYHFKDITTTGLRFAYDVYQDKNTFSNLLIDSQLNEETDTTTQSPTTSDTTTPFDFKIEKFLVTESNITYNDHTLRQPISIPVSQIKLDINNFTTDQPMEIKLAAVVGKTGQLNAHWNGSLSNFHDQKIDVFLRNFQMQDVSPYSVEYLAYPIKDGVLSFVSNNTIDNDFIKSNNKIDIYNCQIDKKIKTLPCEYNIPLRAAVYILTDRKGKITLDLPVSGDINSPAFSYRKIIFKTLGNLIVKVVAAPFDLIAEAIGGEPDIFDDIEYPIHPQGLGSESYDRYNKIADALKAKPELVLTMQQSINKEEIMEEYAIFNTKKSFYQQRYNKQTLEIADYDMIANIKNNDEEFVSYLDNSLKDSMTSGNIAEKCLSLYEPAFLEEQIMNNLNRRISMIINQFATQGVPRTRLEILPLGEKITPKGKTVLSFGINPE